MPRDDADMPQTIVLTDLLSLTASALPAAEAVLGAATAHVRAVLTRDGRISGAALEDMIVEPPKTKMAKPTGST